ncbi:hypothetical protein [Piscinibacterium candidicorallinum]|uniref:Uncharacterized protein n=1 Tax=Piscinibacterium candidicorallinum TaxID=1793872 RepID=A0ABV7HB09_9BURK
MGLSKTAWRVAGALALVALIGIAVQTWRSEERARQAAAEASKAAGRGASASQAGGLSIDELIARGSKAPDVQAAIDRSKPYQTEVCGRGTVTVDPASDKNPPVIDEMLARGSVLTGQLGALLAADGDMAKRAIGLRLIISSETDASLSPFNPNYCDTEECKARQARWVPPSLARLVNLARDSEHPVAYRQALMQCERYRKSEPCSTLSWRRYTEIAPEHFDGWLNLAQDRQAQGDPRGADAAMARAATARGSQSMHFDLRRAAAELMMRNPDGFDRTALMLAVIGIDAVEPIGPLGLAAKHCSDATVRDPGRAAECEQLSRRLEENESLIHVMIGQRIAQRLARDPQRAAAIDAERKALGTALTNASPDIPWEHIYSCDASRRFGEHFLRKTQEGEAAFARRVLAEQRAKAGQAGGSPSPTPSAAR